MSHSYFTGVNWDDTFHKRVSNSLLLDILFSICVNPMCLTMKNSEMVFIFIQEPHSQKQFSVGSSKIKQYIYII